MRIDEKVYNEYANWQLDNSEIITNLKTKGEDLFYRLKHVVDVIDHLYLQIVEDPNYSEEEDQIFQTGYLYLASQILILEEIVEKYYNNDFDLANKYAKDINFLLNTKDFQAEAITSLNEDDENIKKLLIFDKKIIKFLKKHENIPNKLFEELDALLIKIFDFDNINYVTINNIFLEIADELNIL